MAKPAQQPAPAADEEQSFPRGGASSITPLKRRQIRAEAQADAERDFFAGSSAGGAAGNKRRKKGARTTAQVCASNRKRATFCETHARFPVCSVASKAALHSFAPPASFLNVFGRMKKDLFWPVSLLVARCQPLSSF